MDDIEMSALDKYFEKHTAIKGICLFIIIGAIMESVYTIMFEKGNVVDVVSIFGGWIIGGIVGSTVLYLTRQKKID